MSRIDKQIVSIGYKIREIERSENWIDSTEATPIIYLEYFKSSTQTYWAEKIEVTLEDKTFVQIFCLDFKTGKFGIRVSYESEPKNSALGADHEYGTIVRSMPTSELQIFIKKANQLSRKFRFREFVTHIFKRGKK